MDNNYKKEDFLQMMNALLVKLEQWGCDIKESMDRMMNDEAFYIHLLKEFSEDDSIEIANRALEASDYDTAFEAIHKLKGTTSTLGLTPPYIDAELLTRDLTPRPPLRETEKHFRHLKKHYQECSSIILE